MRLNFKLDYDKFVSRVFLVYICFLYAFPYQLLKAEILLLILLIPRLKKIKISIFLWWSISFIAILLLSTIYSIDPEHSLIKVLQIFKSLVFSNILITSINTEEKIEKIFKYFIIAGFTLIIRLLFIFPVDELGKSRLHIANVFNANDTGFKLSISLLFVLYFVFIKKNRSIFLILELIMFYIFIVFTGSRTAFVFGSLEIILLVIFSIKNKMKLILMSGIIGGVIVAFFDEIMNVPIIYSVLGQRVEALLNVFSGEKNMDGSSIIRINMMKDGMKYFFERPFGYGIGSYAFMSPYKTYSHNNYIELLVGVGIFGTIVYYFIHIFVLIKSVVRNRGKVIIFAVLIFINFIVDFGTVSYSERYNIFILALSFLGVSILK